MVLLKMPRMALYFFPRDREERGNKAVLCGWAVNEVFEHVLWLGTGCGHENLYQDSRKEGEKEIKWSTTESQSSCWGETRARPVIQYDRMECNPALLLVLSSLAALKTDAYRILITYHADWMSYCCLHLCQLELYNMSKQGVVRM